MQEPVHVSEQTKSDRVECGRTKLREETTIRMSVAGVYRRVATKSIGRDCCTSIAQDGIGRTKCGGAGLASGCDRLGNSVYWIVWCRVLGGSD